MRLRILATSLTGKLALLLIMLFCISIKSHSVKTKPRQLAKVLVLAPITTDTQNELGAITQLGQNNRFEVVATQDSSFLTDANLRQFKAIVFLNRAAHLLRPQQKQALQNYIRNGGGFVGIHATTAGANGWEWYDRLVGAKGPNTTVGMPAKLVVAAQKHITTKYVNNETALYGSGQTFTSFSPLVKPVLTAYTPVGGGKKKTDTKPHPVIAWYQPYEGGRVFFTGLDYEPEPGIDNLYMQHLLGGIRYAMGKR